jgi:glycosyltransferase involved in cell wall biosynthesis
VSGHRVPVLADVDRRPARPAEAKAGRIHILFTHPFFWPHVNRGAEREIHDLGTRLVARGHDVTLVTTQPHGVTSAREVDGIHVRYIRGFHTPKRLLRTGADDTAPFVFASAIGSYFARSDIVHCWHYVDAAAVVGRGRPVFLKVTGSVTKERMSRSRLHTRLIERAFSRADVVWCNSDWVIEQMSGFNREMTVMPAGVDRQRFRPFGERAPHPTALSTSAPTEPRKRLVDLIDAWPTVRSAHPSAELRLAGDAPREVRAELLGRLPDADRSSVVFLGRLTTDELVGEYSAAWVTVMPAVYEALGLSTLESLACGTPVIGAESGATPMLLGDPGTGTLFEPTDPGDLARVMTSRLRTPPLDRERCRAASAAYDWEAITDRIEDAYRAALGGSLDS